MGVTIRCKKTNDEIEVSYLGFKRLRDKVSELVGDDWNNHYLKLMSYFPSEDNTRNHSFFEEFDRETDQLIRNGKISAGIADFLTHSYIGGSISCDTCKEIWKIVGNYNNNSIYGYKGRENPVRFADFKRVLWTCVDKKCDMVWS